MSGIRNGILGLLLLLVGGLALWDCSNSTPKTSTSLSAQEATYLGSQKCQSCHEEAYADWTQSHHFHALHPALPEFVKGEVSERVSLDGVEYRFLQEDSLSFLEVKEMDGRIDTFTIRFTLGWEPLQQLVVETETGNYQVTRLSWDTEEEKWFHQYPDTTIEPQDWLHWTKQSQNWNSMCADCHVTDFKKNPEPVSQSYHSTWREDRVGCESCHGPGSRHVDLVSKKGYSSSQTGFVTNLKKDQSQIQACAPCHARREKFVDFQAPGEAFNNYHHLQSLNDIHYHGDGQIKEEDYVLASFMSSRMYAEDVTCGDCHNVHSGNLLKSGNDLCMSCHEPTYDSPEHHFHQQGEGTQCVNCHMTGTTYMGNDFRRDHSFRIPRPDQSVAYGTPNACTGCHTGRSDEWAANQVVEWYGKERVPHFSDLLLAGRAGDPMKWVSLVKDTSYPLLARETAMRYLAAEQPVLLENNWIPQWSSIPEFRRAIYLSLQARPETPQLNQLVQQSGGESALSLRVAGKRKLLEFGDSPERFRKLSGQEKQEWMDYLQYNSDFRETRALSGHYQLVMGDTLEGIDQFLKAIQIDSLFVDPYVNGAIMYSRLGKNKEASSLLDRLNRNLPEYDYGWYLHALLKTESGNREEAEKMLLIAIGLNDEAVRYKANLISLYLQTQRRELAGEWMEKSLKKHPNSTDLRNLLPYLQ